MSTRSFRHIDLDEFCNDGKTNKIYRRFHERILDRLDLLEQALLPDDMNVVGFNLYALLGFIPTRSTIYVNGLWSLTF